MPSNDIGTNQRGGWSRRQRLSAFAALFCAVLAISATPALFAQVAEQRKSEQSCREFVQQFYNWYVSRDELDMKSRTGRTTSDDVLRLRPQVLSLELRALLREDSDAQAKANEIVGLDFDPFFNSQDPSPKFTVESVSVRNGRCNAVVNGMREGEKQERVMPELVEAGGEWVFVNFHYRFNFHDGKPPVDDDLIQMLRRLAEDRKKPIQ